MDKLSVAGLVLAIITLTLGAVLKGAGLAGLWSPAAFVIVIVGTIGAVLVQTRLVIFKRALQIVKWIVNPPSRDRKDLIASFVDMAGVARKEGLLALEKRLDDIKDPFMHKGLQMVVDASEPEKIRQMLEIDQHLQQEQDTAAAKVFENAGIYSPTLGIVGAVLGLMAVMKNLSDPSKIGGGIAAAFTATIYGIGLANMFLLPMAGKLKSHIGHQATDRELMIEGFAALAAGIGPREVEARLTAYLG